MQSEKSYQVPLTFAQLPIWIHQELEADAPIYNCGGCLRVRGDFELNRFARAADTLVGECAPLRARIEPTRGGFLQEFRQSEGDLVQIVDFSMFKDARSRAELYVKRRLAEPFAVHGARLFAIELVRVGEDETVIFLKFHHVLMDGMSVENFVARLSELYGGADARPHRQNAITAVLESERLYLQSKLHEEDEKYWRDRMADFHGPAQVNSTAVADAPVIGMYSALVCGEAFRSTREECQRVGTTPFRIALAAMHQYLAMTFGAPDQIIGVATAARDISLLAEPSGCFARVIPVRLQTPIDLARRSDIVLLNRLLANDLQRGRYPYWLRLRTIFPGGSQVGVPFVSVSFVRAQGATKFGSAQVTREATSAALNSVVSVVICDDAGEQLSIDARFDERSMRRRDVVGLVEHMAGVLGSYQAPTG